MGWGFKDLLFLEGTYGHTKDLEGFTGSLTNITVNFMIASKLKIPKKDVQKSTQFSKTLWSQFPHHSSINAHTKYQVLLKKQKIYMENCL